MGDKGKVPAKTKEQREVQKQVQANPGQAVQTPLPEEEPNVDRTQVHKVEPAPTPGSDQDKAIKEQLAEQARRTKANEDANLEAQNLPVSDPEDPNALRILEH